MLVLPLLFMCSPLSWATDVYFAIPHDFSLSANQVANTLKTRTEKKLLKSIESISSKAAASMSGDSNLLIAIGPEALSEVLRGSGNSPVIAVLVSKRSFESIITGAKPTKRSISAIYSDPDPEKQVALAKAIFGIQAKGVLVQSPASEYYLQDFIAAANAYHVDLKVVDLNKINSTENFIELTRSNRILFLIKDPHLFDAVPLEKILLSSYDINHQGTIGYSRGIVKNGGAATTYSSLTDIAESIYQQSRNVDSKKPLATPDFTHSFQVSLNKYVLRSLDIIGLDEDVAHQKVRALMKERVSP